MKLSSKRGRIILVVALLAVAGLIYVVWHWGEESTDDAQIEAHAVSISPKVSGYVKTLNITDNQFVHAGDVLLEIDPTDYQIRLNRAQANLAAAQAGYTASSRQLETTQISAPSNVSAAQAQVDAAQANWQKALNDLTRMQRLSDEARSNEQLDATVAAEKTARSNLEDAKARLRSAETAPKTIATARFTAEQLAAQVKQAQSDVAQAEKDLNDTKLVAQIDGRITNRGVEQGNYVQPGQQLGYLVSPEVWVVANYKETQLKHMRIGQRVSIYVDAFPDAHIEGKIDSFQDGTGVRFSAFPPENATGNYIKIVQRVPVKIVLTQKPELPLPLGPGMSVEPTVYTR